MFDNETRPWPYRFGLVLVLALAAGSITSANERTLGAVEFPISCIPEAQAEFERGVALLHHMMYVESRKTFEQIAATDPDCAMAHWGVVMTLFQPLWPTRPGPEALTRGWRTAQKAKALAPDSDRERAFIAAVESFFREPESPDYWERIRRFQEGMEKVYRAYPEDHEAAAFYALSHLATASQSDDSMAHHEKAAAILLGVYEEESTHPGAIHYTIHANDVDGREAESLHVVRSYGEIAPSVPHALHMPTHIFVRLGAWEDVIQWNQRSAEAALNLPAGEAISHHYPHALDYLIYAYLQRGEDDKAREILEAASSKENYQKSFISAYHLASIPARFLVERRQWAAAAAIPERAPEGFPWERFPWPEAITQFARGLGAARSGQLTGAVAAIEKLAALEAVADKAGEDYFARQIEISRLAVEAWLALGKGNEEEGLRLMRASTELERATEKHPVTPGALAPSSELLGDLLIELGRDREALEAYEASLLIWPGRFNTLLGAARAAAAVGDRALARSYYSELAALTAGTSQRPAMVEARAYLETETGSP